MDFLSVILTLRPVAATLPEAARDAPPAQPQEAPFWWGRAAQAMFLATLGGDLPELAARLHDEQGPHPYTVSTLLGRFPNARIDPQGSYTLRLTAFEAGLAAYLDAQTRPGGRLGPGARLELDRRGWQVEAVTASGEQHPWAGSGEYAALAARAMARAEPPPRRITLQWTSPVTFRSQGRDVPLPIPELVFGSLLERWNACSPVAFPPETRRYAAECLAVTRYDLKTRSVPLKEGAQRVGAVGQVSFIAFNYDRYWMSVLHALASFSLYCGVGAGASHGLGQCRAIQPED